MNNAAAEKPDIRQGIIETGQRLMLRKGFSAVGLNEILTEAGVPKGSFYHYFGSKDAFGEALLEHYFASALARMDETLNQPRLDAAPRLIEYWRRWQERQSMFGCQGNCLAVKLGAEVADLSESMRNALQRGTSGIVGRLTRVIAAGVEDGSLSIADDPGQAAQSLYQLWLGASVLVKITRTPQPFEIAMLATHRLLHLAP